MCVDRIGMHFLQCIHFTFPNLKQESSKLLIDDFNFCLSFPFSLKLLCGPHLDHQFGGSTSNDAFSFYFFWMKLLSSLFLCYSIKSLEEDRVFVAGRAWLCAWEEENCLVSKVGGGGIFENLKAYLVYNNIWFFFLIKNILTFYGSTITFSYEFFENFFFFFWSYMMICFPCIYDSKAFFPFIFIMNYLIVQNFIKIFVNFTYEF